uniref:SH2 domain-containing protein n=1 Tax=Buteo japonicus TaxID=224669 RepID=A0A8C0C1I7_9AVES
MDQCWYHGNITRSRAEDLLSKVGKDGSFLVRASESIASAYALCHVNNLGQVFTFNSSNTELGTLTGTFLALVQCVSDPPACTMLCPIQQKA